MKIRKEPLTDQEHLDALNRVRLVVLSEPLDAIDSTEIGNKFTHCNWGQCTRDGWPDETKFRQDLPDPVGKQKLHWCPLDKRQGGNASYGCFYRCRIFQDGLTDRDRVLRLYDRRLAELQKSQS